jgi:hypothetical protein
LLRSLCDPEDPVNYKTARRHIPEDSSSDV